MKSKKINPWFLISRVCIYACAFWLLVSLVSSVLIGLIPMHEAGASAVLTAVFSGILVYLVIRKMKLEELWEALGCAAIFVVVTVILDLGTAGGSMSLWKLLHWHYWVQFVLYPVAAVATLEK
jgi:hypothetical protein